MKIDPHAPAFPSTHPTMHAGMTTRTAIAMAALSPILLRHSPDEGVRYAPLCLGNPEHRKAIVDSCVDLADDLIARLNQSGSDTKGDAQ
jgi:hypothetical protein